MQKNTQPLRKRLSRSYGFTIVELLVVIVVIAILSGITIAVFNGVIARSAEASMQSDLTSNAKLLENDKTTNGSYPASAGAANGGLGLKTSGDNSLTYVQKPYGYCAFITNTRTTKSYVVKSQTTRVTEGNCDVVVSTPAGSGTATFADGTGTAASFNRPEGLTFAPDGTLYVADMQNHRIRKMTPAGVVTTVAGSGVAGFNDNANPNLAQFNYPSDVAVDSNGNIFVADDENNRIRKITPSGVVSTLAGSGVEGNANGTGTTAQFNHPSGLDIYNNEIYVAGSNDQLIRKITQAGVVTTYAGSIQGYLDGTGTAARFNHPYDLAIDAYGVMYVSDSSNNRIRKILPGGVVTTLTGSGAYGFQDGGAASAQFAGPTGIALDGSGAVYVVDCDNNRIRSVAQNGTVTTFAGSGAVDYTDGIGTATAFNYPRMIAFNPSGEMYMADKWNNRIRKVLP